MTDLNVDKSYHTNLAALHQSNPLVHNLLWNNRPSLVLRKMETKQRNTRTGEKKEPIDGTENHFESNNDFSETYELCCNMICLKNEPKNILPQARRFQNEGVYVSPNRRTVISDLQRLCIAVHMSYDANIEDGSEYLFSSPHREYVSEVPPSSSFNEKFQVLI